MADKLRKSMGLSQLFFEKPFGGKVNRLQICTKTVLIEDCYNTEKKKVLFLLRQTHL